MRQGVLSVVLGVAAVAFVAAPLTSFAGGTISGKVTFAGKAEQKEFSFAKFPNPKFCPKNPHKELMDGDKRFLKQIEVAKDGGLKNAVVAVIDVEDKAFVDGYQGTEVVAEFCEFLPFAGVVVNNKSFKVENHDADPDDPKSVQGVLHNPHSFVVKGTSSATGFNMVWPRRVTSSTSRWCSVVEPRRMGSIVYSAISMNSCRASFSRSRVHTLRS